MELNQIKKLLIKEFDNDFTVKNRKQEFVYQRSIYFRLCREFTTLPLCDIAASLNKNHATVIHSFKVFDNLELWGEHRLLEVYRRVKSKINQTKRRRWIRNCYKTNRERYHSLLHRHINLKQKYADLKDSKEKIY
tara:strand:+ start:1936 stop:2340 length:405 start_codon:yes stop_codon:yes gene_type:complete